MTNSIRKLSREPLLHFLLAGALLFLLYNYVADSDPVADDEILVTAGHIEHLTTLFLKTRQRLPTESELAGLVDDFITEEILYREAKSIGLDENDTIIRRRLRQKMEFLLDDYSTTEASDDELKKYLLDHPDKFRTDDRITFEHVYVSGGSKAEAEALLKELQSESASAATDLFVSGLLPPRFESARKAEVSGRFGMSFTEQLFVQDTGLWTGPLESPFGQHLVLVEIVIPGQLPELDEIRGDVKRDWLFDRQANAEQEILRQLRLKYTVTIETPATEDS